MVGFFLRRLDFFDTHILGIFYLISFIVTDIFLQGLGFLDTYISGTFCLVPFTMVDFFLYKSGFHDTYASSITFHYDMFLPIRIGFFRLMPWQVSS